MTLERAGILASLIEKLHEFAKSGPTPRAHRISAGRWPHFRDRGPQRRIRRLVVLPAKSRACR